MASVATNTTTGVTEPLADKSARMLERLAHLSPTYRRIEALNRTPDAQLKAQGTTYRAATETLFGAHLYI